MKKVLALVLAVIMVCTMAMAVTIDVVVPGAGTATTSPDGSYAQIKPGAKLHFELATLAGDDFYTDKTGEFIPANNAVTVTYGKGAELVASAGWVRIADKSVSTDPAIVKAAEKTAWQYQIVLKDSDTAVCDTKTCDFSIAKVGFKATGETFKEFILDGKDGNGTKFERDYGWTTDEVVLDKAVMKTYTTGLNQMFVNEDVIYTVVAGLDNGAVLNTNNLEFKAGKNVVVFPVTAGQKVLRKNIAALDATTLTAKNGYVAASVVPNTTVINDTNLTGTAVVTNWSNLWNAYVVAADGKTLSKVAVTVNDGVATITVPAYSTGFVYNGVLKGAAAAAPAGTTPGSTTNPGTGANDVVGVAAALAVVALVSGAAISLKK